MSYTAQQQDGHPDVIMRTAAGSVKIPNGRQVVVLKEAGPLDFQVQHGGHTGTVKKANLQAHLPSTVITANPDPEFSDVFLWKGGKRYKVRNGQSLSVVRADINAQGFFLIVSVNGDEYSVKQENVRIAGAPEAAGYKAASPAPPAAAPKMVGKGKGKGKHFKGVRCDPSLIDGAAAVCKDDWRQDKRKEAWTEFNGSVLETALTVVEELGESPVRLVDARFIVELAKRSGRLPRRQDLPEECFISLEKLKRLPKGGCLYDCSLRIIAISHPWQQPDHPDPKGINLQILAGVLSSFLECRGGTYAVFLDFLSVLQKGPNLEDRTREEWKLFSLALTNMMDWYGHPKILTFKITKLPDGYPSGFDFPKGNPPNTAGYFERGWCFCESSVSNLTKDSFKVLDLGAISGTTTKFSDALMECCRTQRRPPISPQQFTLELATKKFTSKAADEKKVSNLYKNAFKNQMGPAKVLEFSMLGWGHEELAVLAQALTAEALPNLEVLDLSRNPMGDAGCTALAKAFAAGASPNLTKLFLSGSHLGPGRPPLPKPGTQIGDAGCTALVEVFAAGALPKLEDLNLGCNMIGPDGITALAEALAAGALPKLEKLNIRGNLYKKAGMTMWRTWKDLHKDESKLSR